MSIIVANKTIHVTKGKVGNLARNYTETARIMDLSYVTDKDSGISRIKKGDSFQYRYKGALVKDKAILMRIKHLVIPPAWEHVWICPDSNGHIQVTGIDAKNRKQYRYHPLWVALRNTTKYYRLRDFGRCIPQIRKKLEADLALRSLSKEKVLAVIVSIMEETSIRVGNSIYEKLYGSYGLSTLKDRHVLIKGNNLQFSFKGKKGVYHNITMKSKKIAAIVGACRDIPGKELFQYYDETGKRHSIDSGEVNEYIRKVSGADFTSKDFRTWRGTLSCLKAFNELGEAEGTTQLKKNVQAAIDQVAACLGNTRTVCKKHYIHPAIISCYEEKKLTRYLKVLNNECHETIGGGLNELELVLLKILEKH